MFHATERLVNIHWEKRMAATSVLEKQCNVLSVSKQPSRYAFMLLLLKSYRHLRSSGDCSDVGLHHKIGHWVLHQLQYAALQAAGVQLSQ